MKKKKIFALAFCVLTSIHLCHTSEDGSSAFNRGTQETFKATLSALALANEKEQAILKQFNNGEGDDTKTVEAAKLALLLVANSPEHQARIATAHAIQTYEDGEDLMVAGATIFTFFQGVHLTLDVAPTSYYSDLRNPIIIVGSAVGFFTFTAGAIKYRFGKSQLEKKGKA